MGTTILAEEREDLVFNLDLLEIRDAVDDACSLAKVIMSTNRMTVFMQLRYCLCYLCSEDQKRWRLLHDLLTDNESLGSRAMTPRHNCQRKERFGSTAAVILSLLAAGIAGDLWGQHQTREDLERLAGQQNHLIAVVKKEMRLNIKEDHRQELIAILGSMEEQHQLWAVLSQGLDVVLGIYLSSSVQVTHIKRAVNELLVMRKVHPTAHRLLGQGHDQAYAEDEGQHKLVPVVLDELDFLRPLVSFGTFSSAIVCFVVHFPMAKSHAEFHLWKFVNLASKVRNSEVFGRVAPAHAAAILAIRRDGNAHFEMSEAASASLWRRADSSFISDLVLCAYSAVI